MTKILLPVKTGGGIFFYDRTHWRVTMLEGTFAGQEESRGESVLLAMSGGVDSTASAVLLQRAGYNVTGLTTRNYCLGETDVAVRSCCSAGAIDDAWRVCDHLDIPHVVADTETVFRREVYDNFVDEYREARTPNPCVLCNSAVRFSTLLDHADRLGIARVATGHYARVFVASSGRRYAARSLYPDKDQSYFLSGLRHETLDRVVFPLGEFKKSNVREVVRTAGLDIADKPESQDVCFVPGDSLREFLDGKIPLDPGDIEDANGNVVGRHRGLRSYTIGQRRGLGISAPRPLYVTRLDMARNVLIVGAESEVFGNELRCRLFWIDDACFENEGVSAKIRSRSPSAPVERIDIDGGAAGAGSAGSVSARVVFEKPQRAIAPGQTIVFYIGDVVTGAGVIESAGEK